MYCYLFKQDILDKTDFQTRIMEHPVDFECYLYSLDHVCPPDALIQANSICQFYLHNNKCGMLQNQIVKFIFLNSLLLLSSQLFLSCTNCYLFKQDILN